MTLPTRRGTTSPGTNSGSFAPRGHGAPGPAASLRPDSVQSLNGGISTPRATLGTTTWGANVSYVANPDDPDGHPASEATYEYDPSENTVEVRVISTAPDYRGRGLASAALARIVEEHPEAIFDTDDFASPWAKHLWRKTLERANDDGAATIDATLDDGRCDWCCSRLDEDADLDVCDKCSETWDDHDSDGHTDFAPDDCWHCHERSPR